MSVYVHDCAHCGHRQDHHHQGIYARCQCCQISSNESEFQPVPEPTLYETILAAKRKARAAVQAWKCTQFRAWPAWFLCVRVRPLPGALRRGGRIMTGHKSRGATRLPRDITIVWRAAAENA